jgi:rhamnulokinase
VESYTAAAGLDPHTPPVEVTRSIIESMAWTCARVIAELGSATDIALFGGGARSALLAERLEAHAGRPVRVGPVEATALGNALVQGLSIGHFADLDEARRALR